MRTGPFSPGLSLSLYPCTTLLMVIMCGTSSKVKKALSQIVKSIFLQKQKLNPELKDTQLINFTENV